MSVTRRATHSRRSSVQVEVEGPSKTRQAVPALFSHCRHSVIVFSPANPVASEAVQRYVQTALLPVARGAGWFLLLASDKRSN